MSTELKFSRQLARGEDSELWEEMKESGMGGIFSKGEEVSEITFYRLVWQYFAWFTNHELLMEICCGQIVLFHVIFPPSKVGGLAGHCGGGGRDNRWGGQGCNPGDNLKLKACLSNYCCISLSSITICLSLKLLVLTFFKILKAITGLDLFIPAFIVTHWNSTRLLLLIIELLFSFENCFPLGEEERL